MKSLPRDGKLLLFTARSKKEPAPERTAGKEWELLFPHHGSFLFAFSPQRHVSEGLLTLSGGPPTHLYPGEHIQTVSQIGNTTSTCLVYSLSPPKRFLQLTLR